MHFSGRGIPIDSLPLKIILLFQYHKEQVAPKSFRG